MEIMLHKPDVNHVLMVAAQLQNWLLGYRNHIAVGHFCQKTAAPKSDHAGELAYWAETFAVSTKLVEIEQAVMYVVGIRGFIDCWDRRQYEDMHAALELIGKVREFLNSRPSYPSLVTYGDDNDMYIKAWDDTDGDSKVNVVVDEGERHGR